MPSFPALHGFLFALALATALLEVEIEGKHGWAKALPTWRFAPRWFRRITNGKELTGYHVSFMLLQLLFFHFSLLFTGFSLAQEYLLLALYLLYIPVWDFLWFMVNPHFGFTRYSARHAWWFRVWLGPFPLDYYICFAASTALFIVSRLAGMQAATVAEAVPLVAPALKLWLLSALLFLAVPAGIVTLLRSCRRP